MPEKGQDILEKLQTVNELPTLPEILQQILATVTDPKSSAQDLGRIIEKDPSLTAKVLRVVNSAFYGFHRHITSVADAVVILGFNEIRILALTISVFDVFDKHASEWNRGDFWRHSLATAVAAEALAKKAGIDPKEPFVAGLLHDLGKVALDHVSGTAWFRVVEKAEADGAPLHQMEMEILGLDHCEVGQLLAEKWRLPEGIVAAIAYHHSPDKLAAQPRSATLARLANIVVKGLHIGSSGNPCTEPKETSMFNRLKIVAADLADVEKTLTEDPKAVQAAVQYASRK